MSFFRIRLKRLPSSKIKMYVLVVMKRTVHVKGAYVSKVGFLNNSKSLNILFVDCKLLSDWLIRGAKPTYKVEYFLSKLFGSSVYKVK